MTTWSDQKRPTYGRAFNDLTGSEVFRKKKRIAVRLKCPDRSRKTYAPPPVYKPFQRMCLNIIYLSELSKDCLVICSMCIIQCIYILCVLYVYVVYIICTNILNKNEPKIFRCVLYSVYIYTMYYVCVQYMCEPVVCIVCVSVRVYIHECMLRLLKRCEQRYTYTILLL